MTPGKKYRNTNPYTTYGIKLLRIDHENDERLKVTFFFVDKHTGSIVDLVKETGRILKVDLKDWEVIE